jgi:transcriptional regulator with XRE-family HTH domain
MSRNKIKKMNFCFGGDDNLLKIGKRVADVKDHFDLNLSQFAKKLNVSHSFLSQIISGKRKPSFELLGALTVLFKVNLSWLYTGKGDMFLPKQATICEDIISSLLDDIELQELIVNLQIPAIKHYVLAQYQLIAGTPECKIQIDEFHKRRSNANP